MQVVKLSVEMRGNMDKGGNLSPHWWLGVESSPVKLVIQGEKDCKPPHAPKSGQEMRLLTHRL